MLIAVPVLLRVFVFAGAGACDSGLCRWLVALIVHVAFAVLVVRIFCMAMLIVTHWGCEAAR